MEGVKMSTHKFSSKAFLPIQNSALIAASIWIIFYQSHVCVETMNKGKVNQSVYFQ